MQLSNHNYQLFRTLVINKLFSKFNISYLPGNMQLNSNWTL